MCGLIAVISKKKKPAGQYAFELYKKQEGRGKEGFGYIAIHNKQIVNLVRTKTEAEIRSKIMKEKAEIVLFHHRMPTSTENTVGTTHPMFVSHDELKYDYYFAHNGIISNASQLKAEHNKLGYNYLTEHRQMEVAEYLHGQNPEVMSAVKIKFNDSESLAIELARNIEGLTDGIKTTGPAAFWGVSVEKGTNNVNKLFFGKNLGRDLCTLKSKKWMCVTSITGTDLQDLMLFSMNIDDMSTEEKTLVIDDAKPIVTSPGAGFERNIHSSYLDNNDFDDERFPVLENRLYTRAQAVATGYSLTQFTFTWFKGVGYYVPNKFYRTSRDPNLPPLSLPNPTQVTLPTPPKPPDSKAMDRLEELAQKYAKLDSRRQVLEDAIASDVISSEYYGKQSTYVEAEMAQLEDMMSATGIEQDTIDEVISIAIEMKDYNESFKSIPVYEL